MLLFELKILLCFDNIGICNVLNNAAVLKLGKLFKLKKGGRGRFQVNENYIHPCPIVCNVFLIGYSVVYRCETQ